MAEPRASRVAPELRIDGEVLRALRRQRPLRTAVRSVFAIGSYAALGGTGLWLDRGPVWAVVWWCQAIILTGFLGAAHDCGHRTFAPTRRANRVCGALWASCVLFNFTIYKSYHLQHHRYTQVPGDPEPPGELGSVWDYVRTLPLVAFFGAFWWMAIQATGHRFPHFVVTEVGRRAVQRDNVVLGAWLVLAVGATVLWPRALLILYWCPLLLYFPMVFFTGFPEHYGTTDGPDPRRNARSCSSNALFRYVYWNGNFHAEHHVYPGIPSRNLPVLHRLIGAHFAYRERSYVLFHLKLLRHLWRRTPSAASETMTPLRRVDYDTYDGRATSPPAAPSEERR